MGVTLYMRTWHRWGFPRFRRRGPPQARKAHGLLLSGLLGVSLALLLIGYLEIRLHPILNAMATAKVTNTVTQTLDGAIANEISSVGITYGDLISMEKDSTGRVTALTSNMAELNRLRTSILSAVTTALRLLVRSSTDSGRVFSALWSQPWIPWIRSSLQFRWET